jgi:DNA-binding MarR family transcriptional regulator
VKNHREDLLRRVTTAEQRMRSLFAYDRGNPMFSSNLTMQQLKVLWLLSTHDGMGSRELAGHLGVTLATLSGIVDRLVAQGYATRSEDPHDRRVRRLHASATGRAAMEEIMESGTKAQRRLFAAMEEIMESGTKAQRRLFDRLDDETLEMIIVVLDRITEAARADALERGITLPPDPGCP